MDLWEALGLLGVLAFWGAIGLMPGCAALAATRGRGSLLVVPASMLAGMAGGTLTPALGGKDAFGFGISLAAALAAGAVATLSTLKI